LRKVQTLLDAGARVVVVAENTDQMLPLAGKSNIELIKSKYSKEYLVGASLVIACTNDPHVNARIHRDCQELEILCNIVDQPQLCDFFVPAVVKRGALQIAIGTEGNSPAFAGHLRKKLEQMFTEEHGRFVEELEAVREYIGEKVSDPGVRKAVLGELVDDESFDYFKQNGPAAWRDRAEKIIEQYSS